MYQEFPAYNISHFYSPKEKKPTVVFCIPGNNFSSSFVNGWTSTLFYLINNPSFLQPRYMNSNSSNTNQELFEALEPVNADNKVKLFGGSWDYEFAFIINPRCKFDIQQVLHLFYEICHNKEFNVLSALVNEDGESNIYKNGERIAKSTIDKNLSQIRYIEADAIDFDFVLIKNEILELIDFSVFDSENISVELSKQIYEAGFAIHISKEIVIEKERAS